MWSSAMLTPPTEKQRSSMAQALQLPHRLPTILTPLLADASTPKGMSRLLLKLNRGLTFEKDILV